MPRSKVQDLIGNSPVIDLTTHRRECSSSDQTGSFRYACTLQRLMAMC
jgi:hypothetical protein